jgi:hypothetical protein
MWLSSHTFKNIFLSTLTGYLLGMLFFTRPRNGAFIGFGFGLGYTVQETKTKIKEVILS